MLNCQSFYAYLESKGINFSTGVPDSLLKQICAYISDNGNDIIAANEGAAIALAAGYHIATQKIPLVYMQNSGFGNIINPLTSLVDPEVYSIPMLLMIGWRGEPGVKDEPQHRKQGRINEALLKALEVPYEILSNELSLAKGQIDKAFHYMKTQSAPFGLLIRKNTFESYQFQSGKNWELPLKREKAIQLVLDHLDKEDIIVSTTGKASREVFEYRVAEKQPHDADFLTVGCMGHASKIALGIALQKPNRNVCCLDGDGAAIMHLGSLAIIGDQQPKNYKHILLNNGSHDSVGGQPSVGLRIDFPKIALSCNYVAAFVATTEAELNATLPQLMEVEGPALLEIKIAKGARADLGRPTKTPIENKEALMKKLMA